MTIKTLYEVLDENKSREEFCKLSFRADSITGPMYIFSIESKYPNPKEAIQNEDFRLMEITPANHEVTGPAKMALLSRLIHNHKKF